VGSLRARFARKPPGYRYTVGRILIIYSGLMVTVFLAALDQTIVATALPRVVSDLGGLGSYSWVFTSYLLASTVSVPIWGKLGDIYGRRPLFLVAIPVFLAGSALCGLAQTLPQLVVFRSIQGLGAGGLIPLALATVANIVPPRDRGRYQGLIGGTFAAASIVGPALGGVIADNTSWRWIFYVNVPVGAVALAVIWFTMPRRAQRREHSIDYLGAALLAAGTTALLLGLIWGGREYPWASLQVVGSLAVGAAVLAVFALVERRAREPILPFDLLRSRSVTVGVASIALVAMCMFGTISFVPLFVQGVIGTSATASGVVLTPMMLAAVTMSVVSGQWVSRTGRYKANALAGPVVLGTAMLLLSRMDVDTTRAEAVRNMVLAGIGMGLMMQIFVLVIQNTVPVRDLGAGTALGQFARAIGATLGVTLMGVIVNQGLPTAARGDAVVHRLPAALRVELAEALRPAFFAAFCVCALVFVLVAVGMRETPLRKGFEEPELAVPDPRTPAVQRR
jgi:EmrB/QacA subfamily drug resistance transporter